MSYPVKGAGYKHMPKWAVKERQAGGSVVEGVEEITPGGAVGVEEEAPLPRERPHMDAAKRLLAEELGAAEDKRALDDFVNHRSTMEPVPQRDRWGRKPLQQFEEQDRQRLRDQGQVDI